MVAGDLEIYDLVNEAPIVTPAATTISPYNVKFFGAVGDGIHDDTAAIQSAINCGMNLGHSQVFPGRVNIYFPPGSYLITSPLNLCNMQGIELNGGAPGFGAMLIGKMAATKSMIEIIGSTNITLRNLQLWGDQVQSPGVGLFVSRSSTGVNSHTVNYQNLQFSGYFTYTPVYIVESESNYFDSCNWFNYGNPGAHGCILSRRNILSLTPIHTTLNNGGNGLWNINFLRCQLLITTGSAVFIGDSAGSVYLADGYLYSDTYPTIEMVGGGYLYLRNIGVEGPGHETLKLTYDAGAFSNIGQIDIDGVGWGAPTDYIIYADDNYELRNSRIVNSPYGSKNIRLHKAYYCDFSGLANYNMTARGIQFAGVGSAVTDCKFRLGNGETAISFGGTNYDNIIEDMSTMTAGKLIFPTVQIGTGSIQNIITAYATWDVGNLADGAMANYFLSMPGVLVDGTWIAIASLSSLGAAGWVISAYPQWGDFVQVTLINHTGGPVDLAPGILRVVAIKVG